MCTYCTHAYQRFPEVLNTFQNMWPDTCISWSFTRKLLFNRLHLSVLPGAVVVLRGISGRCERVRAGNISPAFWGCQGLDKSCLNFSLCKMPCVNSCPWPKHSDLVRQTTGVAHPSPCGLGWQSAWLRFCNQSGLKYSRMSKTSCHFFNEEPILKTAGRRVQMVQRQFSVLQSSAMSRAVGTSCGKSQTGVMSVMSGWSHLCLHYLCRITCHSEKCSNSSWVSWEIVLKTQQRFIALLALAIMSNVS